MTYNFNVPGESPFYTDFLYKVQEDYPDAGLAHTFNNIRNFEISLPKIYAHKDELVELFNLNYRYHELGSETEDRWQYQIDKVFARIKMRYERYFRLYENEDIDELGKILGETIHREGEAHRENENESSGTSKSVFNDTPITPLMEGANYATNINDDTNYNSSDGSSDSTYEDEITNRKIDNDKSIVELANKNAEVWKDLVVAFVDEFEGCFMDELTRI